MRIDLVELRQLAIPMVAPFRSAHGTEVAKRVVILRVEGPDGIGWGECAALAEPTYTSEFTEGAALVLRAHLLPMLLADPEVTAGALAGRLAAVKGHPMAKAAIEMAVLDAELRAADRSFADALGAVHDEVDSGVSVGLAASVGELLDEVEGYVAAGYRRVKLKIRPGWDLEPVRAVRERHPELLLQVDANSAYTLADIADVAALAALDPFDLLLVEQPLAEDDLDGHAELATRIATPICLDESITSVRSAEEAIARRACSVVNLKAGRVGGYLEAVRIHDVCRTAGIPVWCGGMFETGLGRAANLALAGLPGFTLPGDLSASDRYFPQDLTRPFELCDGRLRVPDGPGLGIEPLPDALAAFTTSVVELRPPA